MRSNPHRFINKKRSISYPYREAKYTARLGKPSSTESNSRIHPFSMFHLHGALGLYAHYHHISKRKFIIYSYLPLSFLQAFAVTRAMKTTRLLHRSLIELNRQNAFRESEKTKCVK